MMAATEAHAEVVNYSLENVILDDNNAQMTGIFSWTFDAGDFENGVGVFTSLFIPFTEHGHTDLDAAFDIGKSIEITLDGSVHDDGVDITLFLMQPLTPTTSSLVNHETSKYEIGGNGFHTGKFLSGGSVSPTSIPEPSAVHLLLSGLAMLGLVTRKRRSLRSSTRRWHCTAEQASGSPAKEPDPREGPEAAEE